MVNVMGRPIPEGRPSLDHQVLTDALRRGNEEALAQVHRRCLNDYSRIYSETSGFGIRCPVKIIMVRWLRRYPVR
jgi:hypothetical protein